MEESGSQVRTALREYAGAQRPINLEEMQQQLIQWSKGARIFGRMAYGSLETIHDGLSANFVEGSPPIDRHLRLLREQFQQTEDELKQLAALSESVQQQPYIQLQQEKLQQRAVKMQIMYFAFSEMLVSTQLANEIYRDTAFSHRDEVLKSLEKENTRLNNQLAATAEDAIAEENKKLRLQLATDKEEIRYLKKTVGKLTADIAQLDAIVSHGTCQSLVTPVDADLENQGPSTHNQKRKRSDADALANADKLKIYA